MFQAELHDGQGSPLHLCQKINLYLYAEVQALHEFCDYRPRNDQVSLEVPEAVFSSLAIWLNLVSCSFGNRIVVIYLSSVLRKYSVNPL